MAANIGTSERRQNNIGPIEKKSIKAEYCVEGIGPISNLKLIQGYPQYNVGMINDIQISANYRTNIIVPTSILQHDYGNCQHGIGPSVNGRISAQLSYKYHCANINITA